MSAKISASSERPVSSECVVVLGSGRCGTSLAAQLLSHLGVRIENTLDAAGEQNPYGFSEDKFIVEQNKALLDRLSVNPYFPIKSGDHIPNIESALSEYILKQASGDGIWGFKDPRVPLLLPIYRRIFNKGRIAPKYVLCVRNPRDVLASFISNYDDDPALVQLVWLSKTLASLRETGLNCFILHYESLLADPARQARELSEFIFETEISIEKEKLTPLVKVELDRSSVKTVHITNPLVERLYTVLQYQEGYRFDRGQLKPVVKELSAIEEGFLPWPRIAADIIQSLKGGNNSAKRVARENELREQCRLVLDENDRLLKELAESRVSLDEQIRRSISAEGELPALKKEIRQQRKRLEFLQRARSKERTRINRAKSHWGFALKLFPPLSKRKRPLGANRKLPKPI